VESVSFGVRGWSLKAKGDEGGAQGVEGVLRGDTQRDDGTQG
jgi:hypothetical protein